MFDLVILESSSERGSDVHRKLFQTWVMETVPLNTTKG